jgi:hypothetical protein
MPPPSGPRRRLCRWSRPRCRRPPRPCRRHKCRFVVLLARCWGLVVRWAGACAGGVEVARAWFCFMMSPRLLCAPNWCGVAFSKGLCIPAGTLVSAPCSCTGYKPAHPGHREDVGRPAKRQGAASRPACRSAAPTRPHLLNAPQAMLADAPRPPVHQAAAAPARVEQSEEARVPVAA